MYRPRVSLSSALPSFSNKRITYVEPRTSVPESLDDDVSLQIADIETHGTAPDEHLLVPAIVANVIKEVIREKAPLPPLRTDAPSTIHGSQTFTPFVFEPIFSGADTTLDSNDNRTILSQKGHQLRVKCDTVLIPLDEQVPVKIYLTGKELDLAIEGQRCAIDVFDDRGHKKLQGVAKRDDGIYIEVQDRGKIWEAGDKDTVIRFHIETFFTVK